MNTSEHIHAPPAPGLLYRLMQAMMWPLMKLLGMSCRQFAVLTSLRLDRPLSFTENLRFHMHSLLCHVCRPLPKQLENLRRLTRCCVQAHSEELAATASLPDEAEERIRATLKEQMERMP